MGFLPKNYVQSTSKISLQAKNIENDNVPPTLVPKIDMKNLFQLLTMGAGAPSLGEFKEFDKSGKAIFELEANNFMDSEGNDIQQRGKFFKEGWVDDDAVAGAPGFWPNLFSGGRLMTEWEESKKASK
eukprot:CAMPEP_0182416574 /NCGR_PEP_ID=MMETSP1167-20130531/924_1 /TAXON_ID=2988 /ORGANISM="Mallomonas Sp, Strain CCMP3275" /LENGTH=127 /DNA_ID=CAMNT_0024589479 /DNA_START=119 /DNA_END=502 /DNA_ORIENTATION=+